MRTTSIFVASGVSRYNATKRLGTQKKMGREKERKTDYTNNNNNKAFLSATLEGLEALARQNSVQDGLSFNGGIDTHTIADTSPKEIKTPTALSAGTLHTTYT